MHAGGRPTDYNPEFHPLLAESLAKNGLTDKEIAEKLGICEATLYNWRNEHEEFLEALKKGKDSVDDQVENAMLQRALGYSHPEDKIFQYEGSPIIVPTIKHYPPSEVAGIFWLSHRRPEKWPNKTDRLTGEEDVQPVSVIIEVVNGRKDTGNTSAIDIPESTT